MCTKFRKIWEQKQTKGELKIGDKSMRKDKMYKAAQTRR